ncbi:hypothetical protein N7516_011297 [Penicillium verrucosum]|uniref:uncharacterized protein n=1 Tax=Penicillium verrucosum TaxID=60171 RepID=UPI0025458D47|nr:uncharacterized protein N7516_011297 [Penicillium verrucosum]KAJ5920439.1 hypothetical protein N7516_011297 [Penicillium verrucosum]
MASAKPNTKAEKAKTSDEELITGLSKALGISKAACRMRFIRLQQKHGFKTKGKGSPRRQQAPANNEEATNRI